MSKYNGKTITVSRPVKEIVDKFADLSQLQDIIEKLPDDQKAKFGNIIFGQQSISIETPQVGQIQFDITERSTSKIAFKAVGTPVPLNMDLNLNPVADDSTEMAACVDVQLPMMLRPLIAPQMQKAVDMLTDVMAKIASK